MTPVIGNIDDPVEAQKRDHHAKEIAASESLFEGQPVVSRDKDRHEKIRNQTAAVQRTG
jgi:hypothetical protein